MTDKFPDAFDRYETSMKPRQRGITSFPELLEDFAGWAKTPSGGVTRRQRHALSISAKEAGYGYIMKLEFYKNGRFLEYFRDITSGRFARRNDYIAQYEEK